MLTPGAVPQCQKELPPLRPGGGVVEGEGEDGHEGGEQGGDPPQGPRARCRAQGTFPQVNCCVL